MAESGSLTVYPGAYNAAASPSDLHNVANFVGKGTNNTTYAIVYAYQTTNYAYWPFDVSSVPESAEIDSVSCSVKASLYRHYSLNTCTLRLFSGTTAKGSETRVTTTTATTFDLTAGTWTRDELSSIRLKTEAISSSSGANLYLYGADLTVEYTVDNEKFMLRLDGSGVKLPDGYTRLESIKSTGAQYIDWGFNPNQDTRVVFDFEPASVDGTHLFGCRTASSASDFFLLLCTGGVYRDDYAADKLSTDIAPGERVVIDKNKNVTTIGGETFTHTYTAFSASYPITLFASNTGGTVGLFTSGSGYHAKAYDNGTLIRDCYPYLNPSGVPGLYDIVNGVFYGSATSTPFVAGPEYNDVWHDIARVFKKVSGIWVEQESLEGVVDTSKKLVNGGEIN